MVRPKDCCYSQPQFCAVISSLDVTQTPTYFLTISFKRTPLFQTDDQSAWWYVRFLISWADGSSEGEGVQSLEKVESKKLLTPTLRAVLEEEVSISLLFLS